MTSKNKHWTKKELQVYILLHCANADAEITESEIKLIRSKVDSETFKKIFKEFSNDNEDERFEKIDDNIQQHEYNNMELSKFRKEVQDLFYSDGKLTMMEQNLNRILDNILY
ncbi:hypothetical protein [Psychroserpens sp.]|uniref:hypothetical protein n=1 Tax=Psychroserpens sp. TaxID=2020870 RepID=UPI002B273D25|nr:hypothetical protein [Psychroserpens sp.]